MLATRRQRSIQHMRRPQFLCAVYGNGYALNGDVDERVDKSVPGSGGNFQEALRYSASCPLLVILLLSCAERDTRIKRPHGLVEYLHTM